MTAVTNSDPPVKVPFMAGSTRTLCRSAAPTIVFMALFAIVTVAVPTFLFGGGPSIIAQQATPILLLALGQGIVMLIGSIDLSNAAMALLCSILIALTLGSIGVPSLVLCIAIVTAVGALNGVLVTYTQVPSFALTLGTLGLLQTISLIVTGSNVVYVTSNLEVLSWLFQVQFMTLPIAFWIASLLALSLWVFLRFTHIGQQLVAVGHNERASILSGINVHGLKIFAFALSGFFASLAGISVIAIGGAASSYGLGSDLLLPAIAGVLVGGTMITGGVYHPVNVIFGAAFVALIPVGSAAIGVSTQAQNIVYGLVLIVAVAVTVNRSRSLIIK